MTELRVFCLLTCLLHSKAIHSVCWYKEAITCVLVGGSKAPGRSLSESTGLRSHAVSVEIDRPIFVLASGLKQFAKASCGSPVCHTHW